MSTADGGRRYVFGPLEQRGLIMGLRAGQVALLATALFIAMVVLRSAPDVLGVLAAVAVSLGAVAVAFVPVGGRTASQWAPAAGRRLARLVTGCRIGVLAHRRAADPVALGVRSSRCVKSSAWNGVVVRPPAALAGLAFTELRAPDGSSVAIIHDRGSDTLTAVLDVRGGSFHLLDEGEQHRRLSAWGALLAGLAREGGAVCRVQWIERSVPGDAVALARHLAERGTVDLESAVARSYADLIAEAGTLTREHQCHVALSVRAGRRRGADPESVLLREVRLLQGQLRAADIEAGAPLSLRQVGGLLRSAFDPEDPVVLNRRGSTNPDLAGSSLPAAWPSASEESWSRWRTDRGWHATFWVAEWPRRDVGPDFLGPLLLQASGRRTIAVVMAPLPPSVGVREAEAARTAQAADDQLRYRAGFLDTARRRRESEGLARREAELADGHAAYRFSGYVTVTATDPDALEVACSETVQTAHQCHLDLRRLYGVQDLAFTWTLPLGRGLGRR